MPLPAPGEPISFEDLNLEIGNNAEDELDIDTAATFFGLSKPHGMDEFAGLSGTPSPTPSPTPAPVTPAPQTPAPTTPAPQTPAPAQTGQAYLYYDATANLACSGTTSYYTTITGATTFTDANVQYIGSSELFNYPTGAYFFVSDGTDSRRFQKQSNGTATPAAASSACPTPSPTPAPTPSPTPAPVTPSPTPAPVTPAPVTPSPTPAPVTPAPVTPSPTPSPTPAPVTPSPTPSPTPAPVTPAPSFTYIGTRNDQGQSTASSACGTITFTSMYSNASSLANVSIGDYIYTNSSGTAFNGGGSWWGTSAFGGSATGALQISSSGQVTNTNNCSTPAPTTPSPTPAPTTPSPVVPLTPAPTFTPAPSTPSPSTPAPSSGPGPKPEPGLPPP